MSLNVNVGMPSRAGMMSSGPRTHQTAPYPSPRTAAMPGLFARLPTSRAKVTPMNPAIIRWTIQPTTTDSLPSWRSHRRPDKVEAWPAAIYLNVVRSDYRRRSRRPAEHLQAEAGLDFRSGDHTGDAALESIEKSSVHRALWELPDEQRIAVVSVDICGFTSSETAWITRSLRGTVLSRVHRGPTALAGSTTLRQVYKQET